MEDFTSEIKRKKEEFDYERRALHGSFQQFLLTHTGHLPAAVGLVSSSQSGSSCLLDNDHTCVQVCGEAHMGLGGVSLVSDTKTFRATQCHI